MSTDYDKGPVLEPTSVSQGSRTPQPVVRGEHIALVDLLDRVLAGGVVVSGEVRLAIADVDLVNISLRVLVSSVSTMLEHGVQDGDGLDWRDDS